MDPCHFQPRRQRLSAAPPNRFVRGRIRLHFGLLRLRVLQLVDVAIPAELAGQWWELAFEQALAAQRDALETGSQLASEDLAQMRSERDAAIVGKRIRATAA